MESVGVNLRTRPRVALEPLQMGPKYQITRMPNRGPGVLGQPLGERTARMEESNCVKNL